MLREDSDQDRVVLYMRRGCHVCARVKAFLTENGVDFVTREVDEDPLTPRELWDLFNRKANRLRVPFTALNDGEDVVLGYDRTRLEGVFVQHELGGWQESSRVEGERRYDDFLEPEPDAARWDLPAGRHVDVACGSGSLSVIAEELSDRTEDRDASLLSTERFAVGQVSAVEFALSMSVRIEGQGAGEPAVSAGHVGLVDRTGGFRLGFEVTNDTILAIHERPFLSGVTVPEECYRHQVLLGPRTHADEVHDYAISYAPERQLVRWFVDGEPVYWAVLPVPVEGFGLRMGVGSPASTEAGTGGRDRIRLTCMPWRISTN